MKRLLFVVGVLFLLSGVLQAQIIYVSPHGSDSWTGSNTQPYQTVHKALEKAGVKEVRVAVGSYKVSIRQKGEIVIPRGVTVRGGYLKKTPHEVLDIQSDNLGTIEGQTILQGDSTCRIAKVSGLLEQVTVTGGFAQAGNGGGVYVVAGGVVRNCIISGNQASARAPKVGDLLMKNGDYLDASLFTYDQRNDVAGIVFWVNPQRNAPPGERGRAVSVKSLSMSWIQPPGYDGSSMVNVLFPFPEFMPYYTSVEAALQDFAGDVNTTNILNASADFEYPLAVACRALGPEWYLPAAGEIMWIMGEWSVVDYVFEILWDKIRAGCGYSRAYVEQYFGHAPLDPTKNWEDVDFILHTKSASLASSSSKDKQNAWTLSTFSNEAALTTGALYGAGGKRYRFLKFGGLSVRKF